MTILEVILAAIAVVLMAVFCVGSCVLIVDRSEQRKRRWVQKEFDFTKKSGL